MTALLLSMNAFSGTIQATVKDSLCGEIDPFAIGDACLVYLKTNDNKKIALLMDFDEFQDEYLEEELNNQKVLIDTDGLSNVKGEALLELRSMDSSYFYQAAQMSALKVLKMTEMDRLLLKIGNGYFHTGKMPKGYTAKKMEVTDFRLNKNFKRWLKAEKVKKMKLWTNLILNSGEYDYLSVEERQDALSNPEKFLGADHLLEIDEVNIIRRGSKVIGFFLEVNDHVQAAEYQDGAWMELFLNLDQKVLRKLDLSA